MKIILIHHFPGVGGGTISALDLARMFEMLGHQVTLAVPSPCQMIKDSCDDIGVNLCSVECPPLFTYHNASTSFLKCAVKYFISLGKNKYWQNFFAKEKPDLVLLNSSPLSTLSSMLKKKGIPCICYVRETFRQNGNNIANSILRNMIGQCDMALYLTEYDRKCWKTKNALQFVMPDVVDDFRYKKHKKEEIQLFKFNQGLNNEIKYILYLGGISKPKGSLDLLKAYQLITSKHNDIGLILLGDTYKGRVFSKSFCITHQGEISYIKACRKIINYLKTKGSPLHEIGIVDDPSFWYEVSDVVVFPVNLVHQPRPAYEAGYYGKPIVLPKLDNFMEYVVDGTNGFLYNKNDENDLAEKLMLSMEGNNSLEVGRANQMMCEETHSFNVGIKILEKCINSL